LRELARKWHPIESACGLSPREEKRGQNCEGRE